MTYTGHVKIKRFMCSHEHKGNRLGKVSAKGKTYTRMSKDRCVVYDIHRIVLLNRSILFLPQFKLTEEVSVLLISGFELVHGETPPSAG